MNTQSRETWLAAHEVALRAIPVLLAKGMLQHAADLHRRAQQFLQLAERTN